jgi:ketol-acid reductoisomerase
MTATRFFTLADAAGLDLRGQKVAVLGYGSLGRPIALNLRDSGVDVVVGNRDDEYRPRAEADGFPVVEIAEASGGADIAFVLIPDEEIGECFATHIGPGLRPGAALCFASGYALAFGFVVPPAGLDVLLFAPRMLGDEVRRTYLDGSGFFSYLSVERAASTTAWARLLALAAAAGSLRRGAMHLTATQEAVLDLFIEQSVGAYLGTALQIAFQVGVVAGLPPEALVLEMYQSGEMARTFEAFSERGFFRSVGAHGVAAAFGGYLRTLELDRAAMERHFGAIHDDIASGGFAGRFQAERNQAYPVVELIRQVISGDDPMSHAEDRVRGALGAAAAGANGHGGEPGAAPAWPAGSPSSRPREAAGGVEPGPGGGRR